MNPKSTTYYDWFEDIQPCLAKNIGITYDQFREYHKVVHPGYNDIKGYDRRYYDFWHVWLEFWGERVRNDSYDTAWFQDADYDEEWAYFYETAIEKYGEWATKLVDAVRQMVREHGMADKEIIIRYSW